MVPRVDCHSGYPSGGIIVQLSKRSKCILVPHIFVFIQVLKHLVTHMISLIFFFKTTIASVPKNSQQAKESNASNAYFPLRFMFCEMTVLLCQLQLYPFLLISCELIYFVNLKIPSFF